MIIRTMKQADKVLALVKKAPWVKAHYVYLEGYQNGREHGWSLSDFDRQVVITNDRHSDAITVYAGAPGQFSMQGNVPDDAIWKGQHCFTEGAYELAAEFVVAYLAAPAPATEGKEQDAV